MSYKEETGLQRPKSTFWSKITEGIKYIWEPGKTCKNEIMRGKMSSDRIRDVIIYALENKDSWGNTLSEEQLQFLYRYNKHTINSNEELKNFIRNVVHQIRRKNPKTYLKQNKNGLIEELPVSCANIDWLDE